MTPSCRAFLILLAAFGPALPAYATTFRVDAESDGSTIVGCGGRTLSQPCCRNCHSGPDAAAVKKEPPKHDRALYGKYLYQLPEGARLKARGESWVTREKGDLVLYEGKTRKVLPRGAMVIRDPEGRAVVVVGD